mmetsp:Transcript_30318/g.39981  ORF Transcript_30318/g.39981 Transcript_30318/m.39981 type:complete len:212 (-) Transcript_30318:940-1575(-)
MNINCSSSFVPSPAFNHQFVKPAFLGFWVHSILLELLCHLVIKSWLWSCNKVETHGIRAPSPDHLLISFPSFPIQNINWPSGPGSSRPSLLWFPSCDALPCINNSIFMDSPQLSHICFFVEQRPTPLLNKLLAEAFVFLELVRVFVECHNNHPQLGPFQVFRIHGEGQQGFQKLLSEGQVTQFPRGRDLDPLLHDSKKIKVQQRRLYCFLS